MTRLAVLLVVTLAVSSCSNTADDVGRAIAVRPPPNPQAWIHVEAIQTDCCYDEGSTDVLEITNRDGFRMTDLAFANKQAQGDDAFVGRFDAVAVAPGPHTVMVWQEDCGGGCSWVEGGDNSVLRDAAEGPHRRDLCAITVEVVAGDIFIEARWSPFVGCQSIDVVPKP